MDAQRQHQSCHLLIPQQETLQMSIFEYDWIKKGHRLKMYMLLKNAMIRRAKV